MSDISSLSNDQILFLAKLTASADFKRAASAALAATPVGSHTVPTFAVEVGGNFDRAEDGDRAGTVSGLTAPVLGLTLHYAGVTGDAAQAAYTRAINELGSLTAAKQKAFIKKLVEEKGEEAAAKISQSIDETLSNLRSQLPRIPVKGSVKARGFVRPVEVVLSKPVEVVTDAKGQVEVVAENDEITEAIFIINAK